MSAITDKQMRQAEDAVLRVLTNGEPVTHEILDALTALGWAPPQEKAPESDLVAEAREHARAARRVKAYETANLCDRLADALEKAPEEPPFEDLIETILVPLYGMNHSAQSVADAILKRYRLEERA